MCVVIDIIRCVCGDKYYNNVCVVIDIIIMCVWCVAA